MVKTMHPALIDIQERKKREVAALHESGLADKYEKEAVPRDQRKQSFYDAITAPRKFAAPNLIAEFKRTSPSNIRHGNPPYKIKADPVEQAKFMNCMGHQQCLSLLIKKVFMEA